MGASIYKRFSWATVFFAVYLFACGREAGAQINPSPAVSPVMHEVTDGYGRIVRIPVRPSRIISLAPSLTETVYALGVQDRLVGDTDYCDYPPEAQKKPKVGGVINPSLEEIAALHPDLVLMTKEGNLLETVRALESLGIPTYATDIHSIDQVITSTQKLSDVLNVPEQGRRLAADLEERLNDLQTRLTGVRPRRVLFVVWPDPLQSVGKNTFVADALRRAGAESIIDSNQDWPQVSLEEVARLQPEDLIFAPSHSIRAGNDFEAVANRPGWDMLNAVRKRRYAVVSEAIIRPTPRIVSVIEDLARQLHPEAFGEMPVNEKQSPAPNAASSSHLQIAPTSTAEVACSL